MKLRLFRYLDVFIHTWKTQCAILYMALETLARRRTAQLFIFCAKVIMEPIQD